MAEYRHTETGEIKSQGEWRKHYSNVSLPRVWRDATLSSLKLEPVFDGAKPTPTRLQRVVKGDVVKSDSGDWVRSWVLSDIFSDYTDQDGVTHTKADQEAEYLAKLDEGAANRTRSERDKMLAETDWVVVMHTEKGTNIPVEWEIYRQALRDITDHVNFPHLQEGDWPVKP